MRLAANLLPGPDQGPDPTLGTPHSGAGFKRCKQELKGHNGVRPLTLHVILAWLLAMLGPPWTCGCLQLEEPRRDGAALFNCRSLACAKGCQPAEGTVTQQMQEHVVG